MQWHGFLSVATEVPLFLQPDRWKEIHGFTSPESPGRGQGPINRACGSCSHLRTNTDSSRLQNLDSVSQGSFLLQPLPIVPAVPYRPCQNSGCAGSSMHTVATTMGGVEGNASSQRAKRLATPLLCQQCPLPSPTPFCLWTSKAALLQVIKGF